MLSVIILNVCMLSVIMLSVLAPLSCKVRDNKNENNQQIPAGNTKGGSITVPLTSCMTGLD
jgi:hypothetical protein